MSSYVQSTTIIGIAAAVAAVAIGVTLWRGRNQKDENEREEILILDEAQDALPIGNNEEEPNDPGENPDLPNEPPNNWSYNLLQDVPQDLDPLKRLAPELDDRDFDINVKDFVSTFQTLCFRDGETSRKAILPLWEFLRDRYTSMTVDTPKKEMKWSPLRGVDESDPNIALWKSWNDLVDSIPEHDKDLKFSIRNKVIPLLGRSAIRITKGCVTIEAYLKENEHPQVLEAVKCRVLSKDEVVREVGNLITAALVSRIKATMNFDSLDGKNQTTLCDCLALMSKLTDFHLLGTVQSLQEESSVFEVHICTFRSLKRRSKPQRETTSDMLKYLPKNIKAAMQRRQKTKKQAVEILNEAAQICGLTEFQEDIKKIEQLKREHRENIGGLADKVNSVIRSTDSNEAKTSRITELIQDDAQLMDVWEEILRLNWNENGGEMTNILKFLREVKRYAVDRAENSGRKYEMIDLYKKKISKNFNNEQESDED